MLTFRHIHQGRLQLALALVAKLVVAEWRYHWVPDACFDVQARRAAHLTHFALVVVAHVVLLSSHRV